MQVAVLRAWKLLETILIVKVHVCLEILYSFEFVQGKTGDRRLPIFNLQYVRISVYGKSIIAY